MATPECKVESWDEEVAFNIDIRFFTLFQFPIMFGFFFYKISLAYETVQLET